MNRIRKLLLLAIAIVAGAAGLLLSRSLHQGGEPAPALEHGTWLEPARALPPFTLLDTDEKSFGHAQLQGRWNVLFFGFATCPDVCPTTLAVLAQTRKALADLPAERQPRVIFVTVDPQRDTPAILRTYLQFFDPGFIGLSGEPAQIDALTRGLGTPFAARQLDNGSITFDHSAALFVVDPRGRLRALFSGPHAQDALAADLRKVLAYHTG